MGECKECGQVIPEVPQAPAVVQPVQVVHKPGYKTTEFWITIATSGALVLEAVQGALPPQTATIVAGLVTGLYALSRGLSKSKA